MTPWWACMQAASANCHRSMFSSGQGRRTRFRDQSPSSSGRARRFPGAHARSRLRSPLFRRHRVWFPASGCGSHRSAVRWQSGPRTQGRPTTRSNRVFSRHAPRERLMATAFKLCSADNAIRTAAPQVTEFRQVRSSSGGSPITLANNCRPSATSSGVRHTICDAAAIVPRAIATHWGQSWPVSRSWTLATSAGLPQFAQ